MGTKYGTARQIVDVNKELDNFNAIQNDPYKYGTIDRKDEFRKNKAKIERAKSAITPPPLASTEERDRLLRRQEQLANFIVNPDPSIKKPEMPSEKEMWDMPAGAVGKHRRWENAVKKYTVDSQGKPVAAKAGYGAESEWKDNQRRLNTIEDQLLDPDVSSLETMRPRDPQSRSLIDYSKLSYAQGANVSEAQWNERVGEKPPMAHPPAAVQKKGRKKRVLAPEDICPVTKKDGSQCTAAKLKGQDYCVFHRPKA